MGDMTIAPGLDYRVSLDGDVTTVTFTITNRSTSLCKELTCDGFTLGKIAPREKATLPIKVAELAPKASHEFVLHYDHVKWLGDEVTKDRIDTGWAQQPLSYSCSCVLAPDASAIDSSGKVKLGDSRISTDHHGVPVSLDKKTAEELKARRDLGRPSSTSTKETHSLPSSSKP
jgi:hypothetical protein